MCGEVVCTRCSMHRKVKLPFGESKTRVCSACFFHCKEHIIHTNVTLTPRSNTMSLDSNSSNSTVCLTPTAISPTSSTSSEDQIKRKEHEVHGDEISTLCVCVCVFGIFGD